MAITLTEILAPATSANAGTTGWTYTTSADVGDFLIICTTNSTAGTQVAPTDTVGNTYIVGGSTRGAGDATVGRTYIHFCQVSVPIIGGSTVLKVSAGSVAMTAMVSKVVGGIGSIMLPTFDKNVSNVAQTSATPNTGSTGTLAQDIELAVAFWQWTTSDTFTEPAGYTNPHGAGVAASLASQPWKSAYCYNVTAATTALNPTCTLGASVNCGGGMITFKIRNRSVIPTHRPAPFKPGIAR